MKKVLLYDRGRHRLRIVLGQTFKFGWHSSGPGSCSAGFGFGMFSYIRRDQPRVRV